MGRKRRTMKVDSTFYDKVFGFSDQIGMSAADITKHIADQLDDIKVDIKPKKGGFKFFK